MKSKNYTFNFKLEDYKKTGMVKNRSGEMFQPSTRATFKVDLALSSDERDFISLGKFKLIYSMKHSKYFIFALYSELVDNIEFKNHPTFKYSLNWVILSIHFKNVVMKLALAELDDEDEEDEDEELEEDDYDWDAAFGSNNANNESNWNAAVREDDSKSNEKEPIVDWESIDF